MLKTSARPAMSDAPDAPKMHRLASLCPLDRLQHVSHSVSCLACSEGRSWSDTGGDCDMSELSIVRQHPQTSRNYIVLAHKPEATSGCCAVSDLYQSDLLDISSPTASTANASEMLPPIEQLPSLPEADRKEILDLLFEPSAELHALCLELTALPFPSYAALAARIGGQLRTLAASQQAAALRQLDAVLGSHPRLGEKHVDSAQSRAEQAAMAQAGGGGAEQVARLAELNRQYESTFPGLRYVVFVNGRPRPIIMQDMQARIAQADIERERQLAIQVRRPGKATLLVDMLN